MDFIIGATAVWFGLCVMGVVLFALIVTWGKRR